MNKITLNINYLNTDYEEVNKKIDFIIKKYIKIFYNKLNQFNTDSILDIKYETYEFNNILSNSIKITFDYKDIDKINYIETIIYDKNKNMFITLNDLLRKNKYLLYKLSKISRKYLFKKNILNKEIIYKKTMPNINNYSKFILTNKGLKIYFDDKNNIIIPYKFLKNKKV